MAKSFPLTGVPGDFYVRSDTGENWIVVLQGGQFDVEVQNRLPDTASMMIGLSERACFTFPDNRQQPDKRDLPIKRHYYVNDSLLKGEVTDLRVLIMSDQVFHAIKEKRCANYMQMNDDIRYAFPLCKKLERDDLVIGTPVVWRQRMESETFFWRCCLLEDADGGECVLVRLMDRGEKEKVPTRELRVPPTCLLQESTFSLTIRLNPEQELDCGLRALLKPSVSITVKTEEVGSDTKPYIVTVV